MPACERLRARPSLGLSDGKGTIPAPPHALSSIRSRIEARPLQAPISTATSDISGISGRLGNRVIYRFTASGMVTVGRGRGRPAHSGRRCRSLASSARRSARCVAVINGDPGSGGSRRSGQTAAATQPRAAARPKTIHDLDDFPDELSPWSVAPLGAPTDRTACPRSSRAHPRRLTGSGVDSRRPPWLPKLFTFRHLGS